LRLSLLHSHKIVPSTLSQFVSLINRLRKRNGRIYNLMRVAKSVQKTLKFILSHSNFIKKNTVLNRFTSSLKIILILIKKINCYFNWKMRLHKEFWQFRAHNLLINDRSWNKIHNFIFMNHKEFFEMTLCADNKHKLWLIIFIIM
uniref:Uncharacterized protein n=1 Tax=Meloidogyne incognita TaxID=6306 RepID=A0A914MYM0_MELIC